MGLIVKIPIGKQKFLMASPRNVAGYFKDRMIAQFDEVRHVQIMKAKPLEKAEGETGVEQLALLDEVYDNHLIESGDGEHYTDNIVPDYYQEGLFDTIANAYSELSTAMEARVDFTPAQRDRALAIIEDDLYAIDEENMDHEAACQLNLAAGTQPKKIGHVRKIGKLVGKALAARRGDAVLVQRKARVKMSE